MNRSKQRHTFQADSYVQRCLDGGDEPIEDILAIYAQARAQDLEREHNEEWKKNNLEYDLRSTDWICDKAKANPNYAQNIYAALCNQAWQRNDVWPRLKDETWSCSWRYAGGIVADMCEQGDYIDYYCSGIRGGMSYDDELEDPQVLFVSEGTVTDEVCEDFFRLGWIPVDHNQDDYK